jgi:hypothetical protein
VFSVKDSQLLASAPEEETPMCLFCLVFVCHV